MSLGDESTDNDRKLICSLGDIPDGTAREFALPDGRDILVARRGGAAFAYVNSCPHLGSPLNWRPDQFMSLDRRWLQCATHGARFRIEDGVCVAGPCTGGRLERVALAVDDGALSVVAIP